MPDVQAYFEKEGDAFKPYPWARSPWTPAGTHGRLCAGLIARAIEINHGDPDFLFARLTTDLFRMAPLAPLKVRTTSVRDGNRIRVADGEVLEADTGIVVARASAVMLRKGINPEGDVWKPPTWQVPKPEEFSDPEQSGLPWHDPIRQFHTIPSEDGRKRVWIRDNGQLVLGEEMTPFVRVATQADYTNPFLHREYQPVGFINAEVTLYLHRYPVEEWIGFEASSHQSAEGVAVGSAFLYDVEGPIGHSLVCCVADDRRRNITGER